MGPEPGCPPRPQRSATDTISTVTPTTTLATYVEARITYKLCLLMYRVVHRTVPVYLAFCQPCTDPRRRSTARGDFEIPRTNPHFKNSSFSIAAPTVWNKLPTHIRTSTTLSSFLSRLKTRLYTTSFAVP